MTYVAMYALMQTLSSIVNRDSAVRVAQIREFRTPAQHQRIEASSGLDQVRAGGWMKPGERRTRRFALDDPALLHQCLAGKQAALPILVVDQRQPTLVEIARLRATARVVRVDDLANAVGIAAARHRARGPGVSVIASSPSHGPSIASPPRRISSRELRRGAGGLDLEIRDVLNVGRHVREERGTERSTCDRRVLKS